MRALEIMKEEGFEPNTAKSAMIARPPLPEHRPIIPMKSAEEEFVMLGVNITQNFDAFNTRIRIKVSKFFDLVDDLRLHPEAVHKILHFCGSPKLLFYASTTPVESSGDILRFFQERAAQSFAKLVDVDPSVCTEKMERRFQTIS
jgi:hypothetical protein